MKKKIFVDGSYGTVGLSLCSLVKCHPELTLLEIAHKDRKKLSSREQLIRNADLVVTCLPNSQIDVTIKLIPNEKKLIDCSTKFRCSEGWVYGLPELNSGTREEISKSFRVANPGCFACAFILAMKPLTKSIYLNSNPEITAFAITGYSAGRKRMINQHEQGKSAAMFHGLDMTHKHLPEMQMYTSLRKTPLFIPSVGSHKEGMILTIPFNTSISRTKLIDIFSEEYSVEKFISINTKNKRSLSPSYPSNNHADIYIGGNPEQLSISVHLNNLYKGAAGNVLQCINLMLGYEECTGLI